MSSILIKAGTIVTVNNNGDILNGFSLAVENGKITKIDKTENFSEDVFDVVYDYSNYVIIPGFVQTHVHLCQTLFRGLADDLELLDWLRKHIFPYEFSHDEESLRASAKLGIYELLTGGTTTILDMGTMNHQQVVFDELISSGIRAFAGKCMIDENDIFPGFKEDTKKSIEESYSLAREFHNSANGRIKYAFAPRFVLSCSEKLLIETREIQKDFAGSLYHTHSSENKGEIKAVKEKTGMENIEYFNSIGVLGSKTILAHGIHVNEKEIGILKETDTKISHCPSANLKLASGIANIPRYLDENISVSLGADGPPCNNNLSMFTEMRLASLIQKPIHGPTSMRAETVFRLATIEGAKALGIEDEIGSIEEGKKADLVALDLNNPEQPLIVDKSNIYSAIIYSSSSKHVKEVFVDGKHLVSNGKSLVYDKDDIFHKGKKELNKLLKRVANK